MASVSVVDENNKVKLNAAQSTRTERAPRQAPAPHLPFLAEARGMMAKISDVRSRRVDPSRKPKASLEDLMS